MEYRTEEENMISLKCMSAIALLFVAAQLSAAPTAIVGVTLVDPSQDDAHAATKDATVVFDGDRIVAAGPSASVKVPKDATRIDGKGHWLIPGLTDGHVHFFQSGNLYTRPDVADFNAVMPYAKEVERNKAHLPAVFKVWLASGVTSVVDVGGPFWNFDVRDIAAKTAAAPRVEVAGPLISMVARPQLELDDPPIIKIDSPQAARDLVARELKRKPDFIKVWYIHQKGDDLAKQEEIVKAAADAAHAAHTRLAVHATELLVAKSALKVGADYLVHSVEDEPIDDEFIALLKKNHAIECPTLFVYTGYRLALSNQWKPTPEDERTGDPRIVASLTHDLDTIPADKRPPIVVRMMASPNIQPPTIAMQNLKKLRDAGIPIVMGTDAGNIGTLHGPSVFREMAMMHEAGLSPLEVLRSATVNGAKAMGRSDLGTIAKDKRADMVLLDADPLADVGNLSHAERVIKAGVVYDPKALIDSIR
jgi:imidazolonepropionase-like amidohydrolase